MKFDDLDEVINLLKQAQEAELDQRETVAEQKSFCLEKDGQWDSRSISLMKDRYRGTFDQVSPILDQITGEMDESEYAISVSPSGGDATEDTADTLSGLVRNIENISNAKQLYSQVGQSVVMAGLDGFEITQGYLDANTFDQDLLFKPVSDWFKSVWFDLGAVKQDKSDAKWAVKLRELPQGSYNEQFPKGSGLSVGDSIITTVDNKFDSVTVGRIYYKKPIKIELARMTNGAVYVVDDKFNALLDERAAQGITVEANRTRKSWRVWSRLFDGKEWLTEEEETVFSYIPLIPAYGNYSILDTKNIYFGKTLKLIDPQRGLNFAISAGAEDVAMSPNDSIWMTKEQARGEDYSKMNVDRKAIRFYNHQDGQMPPSKMGAGMGNPGLQNAAATFQGLLQKTGNMDDPSMGQNPGLQSGMAVNALVAQSNNGNVKWFKSMEICICHAYKVLVDAIPRVYDATRQQRILSEDGTSKTITLNTQELDVQTGQYIDTNDLSRGTYDATCSMGAAFSNRQEKTTQTLLDMMSVDPTFIEIGRDVFYKNQTDPGMQTLADRARAMGIESGIIKPDEYTPEEEQEQQMLAEQQAQQPPPEDPMMVAAQAEMLKAQAEMKGEENKAQEIQIKGQEVQVKMQEAQIKGQEVGIKAQDSERKNSEIQLNVAKLQQEQQKLDTTKEIDTHGANLKTREQEIKIAEVEADIAAKKAKAKRDTAEAEQTEAETEAMKSGVIKLMKTAQARQMGDYQPKARDNG